MCLRNFSVLLAGYLLFSPQAFAADSGCKVVSSAVEIASRIRGLKPTKVVPCKVQDRKEVESYLRETLKKKVPQERLLNEERHYKLIGFLPLAYDYQNGLIQLYTEQLGGYYDPDQDFYAMASWMPEMVQMPIAVHELTHALQDQHYDLGKMMDQENATTDALLARSALVEGDATAVMVDYGRAGAGAGPLANEKQVSAIIMQNLAGAMFSTGLHQAPPALQALLVFPYMSGLHFVHKLLMEDGYRAVDKAFAKLPQSTEEILHPEKYLAGTDTPRVIAEADLLQRYKLEASRVVSRDTFGEFMISSLLAAWLTPVEARKAAEGWNGDLGLLLNVKDKKYPFGAALWCVAWDSEAEAIEFFNYLIRAYESRFSNSSQRLENAATLNAGELGQVNIRIEGDTVFIDIGIS